MKKFFGVIITMVLCSAFIFLSIDEHHYSKKMEVIEVCEDDSVYLEDSAGRIWFLEGVSELSTGEMVTCTFHDMSTPSENDDLIINYEK